MLLPNLGRIGNSTELYQRDFSAKTLRSKIPSNCNNQFKNHIVFCIFTRFLYYLRLVTLSDLKSRKNLIQGFKGLLKSNLAIFVTFWWYNVTNSRERFQKCREELPIIYWVTECVLQCSSAVAVDYFAKSFSIFLPKNH